MAPAAHCNAACVSFLLMASVASASVFCPHTVYPSDESDFVTAQIKQEKDQVDQLIYRIATVEQKGKKAESKGDADEQFRLLKSIQHSECPSRACVAELAVASPKNYGSLLYHTNILGKVIPPGFNALDMPQRRYCVIVKGDCGADIPIYRHFRVVPGGRIYHAYTTEDELDLAMASNYTRESMPLCYAWAPKRKAKPSVKRIEAIAKESGNSAPNAMGPIEKFFAAVPLGIKLDTESTGAEKIDCAKRSKAAPEAMATLTAYDNHKAGPLRDHFYTTQPVNESDYTRENALGKVIVDKAKSDCSCLVHMAQLYSGADGPPLIARKDHKLNVVGQPPIVVPAPLAPYEPTGEEFYCAKEKGACGATLPIRSFFHLAEMDSIITLDSASAPPLAIPSSAGVLCYIWPMNYRALLHSEAEANSTMIGG